MSDIYNQLNRIRRTARSLRLRVNRGNPRNPSDIARRTERAISKAEEYISNMRNSKQGQADLKELRKAGREGYDGMVEGQAMATRQYSRRTYMGMSNG